MDHLEAIVEIKNMICPKFIDKIIPLIKHKAKNKLPIGLKKTLNYSLRNVYGYPLNSNTPTNMFYWNYIKQEIEKLYTYYKIKFPLMASSKIKQIDLLKYSLGGKYEIHIDHGTNATRHLSIIMNLNNDYQGGDLIFTDQKHKEIKRLKLGKGSIVFFPSNFMYPHSIQPITKGTRYSIVAWLQ
jgi:predicted 2-oxoglutarate/Fe(II)-dependent dioxygenase YbiX|tara:strand:- start:1527 stop:2078 length:552 start_codon:yes stop_codon:yes gene_type:complete